MCFKRRSPPNEYVPPQTADENLRSDLDSDLGGYRAEHRSGIGRSPKNTIPPTVAAPWQRSNSRRSTEMEPAFIMAKERQIIYTLMSKRSQVDNGVRKCCRVS